MTTADKIRQHPDKPAALVAQIVGCSVKRVHGVRYQDLLIDTPEYRSRRRRNNKAFLIRHGVAPFSGRPMTRDLSAEVIRLRSGGLSQKDTAKSLGLTIGQVASVMYLYRKRLEKEGRHADKGARAA